MLVVEGWVNSSKAEQKNGIKVKFLQYSLDK